MIKVLCYFNVRIVYLKVGMNSKLFPLLAFYKLTCHRKTILKLTVIGLFIIWGCCEDNTTCINMPFSSTICCTRWPGGTVIGIAIGGPLCDTILIVAGPENTKYVTGYTNQAFCKIIQWKRLLKQFVHTQTHQNYTIKFCIMTLFIWFKLLGFEVLLFNHWDKELNPWHSCCTYAVLYDSLHLLIESFQQLLFLAFQTNWPQILIFSQFFVCFDLNLH